MLKKFAVALVCGAALANAYADTVVIVSAKSSVSSLSKEQVADLFLGKETSLAGDSAVLVDMPDGAIREAFYDKVAGRTLAQVKATWSKLMFTGKGIPPKEVATPADVKKAVAASTHAVGYVDSAQVDASVKAVLTLK